MTLIELQMEFEKTLGPYSETMKDYINEIKEPSAIDCWHFIAPLIPITRDKMTIDIYVKTFHAFQLLEREEKENKDEI